MRKSLFLILLAVFSYGSTSAQLNKTDSVRLALAIKNLDTNAWVRGGILNVGINEGFLHNWAAGGEIASLTVNGQFSGFLNRILYNHVWSNNLDLNYGLFYGYSNSFIPRKTDDRIDFTSKYGTRIGTSDHFLLSGLFNFKSQFTKGFDYSVPNWDSLSTSEFLSPGYFTAALGLEYRRGNSLSLFLSPLAARVVVAKKEYTSRKPEGAFGIPYNKTSRFQLGAYFTGRYEKEFSKNLLFKTRVDLYSNYLAKDKKDSMGRVVRKDNPGNIDILWDNFFSYRMSKYLSLTLAATFIYDNDLPYSSTYVDATTGLEVPKDEPGQQLGWWQVKQILTVGFQYSF